MLPIAELLSKIHLIRAFVAKKILHQIHRIDLDVYCAKVAALSFSVGKGDVERRPQRLAADGLEDDLKTVFVLEARKRSWGGP